MVQHPAGWLELTRYELSVAATRGDPAAGRIFPLVDERLSWLAQPVRDAVLVVLTIASHSGPMVSSVIAAQANLSTNRFARAAQCLIRAKLVIGCRGAGGGYRLAQDPGELTLLQIAHAAAPPRGLADPPLAFAPLAASLEEWLRGRVVAGALLERHDAT